MATPACAQCGSERIEYHEDVVARRHFVRVDDNGLFVFQSITDSFDDDGDNPRLWCGDCSHEWPVPSDLIRNLLVHRGASLRNY